MGWSASKHENSESKSHGRNEHSNYSGRQLEAHVPNPKWGRPNSQKIFEKTKNTRKICCIIDIDGFPNDGNFLPRELGWIHYISGKSNSIRFDLRPYRKSVQHNMIPQSSLSFYPSSGEPTVPLKTLEQRIKQVYNSCRSNRRVVVGFKGGNQERDILQRLQIPCINIEDLGCPKYDSIRSYSSGISCGYHTGKRFHCARAEVTAFRQWLVENCDGRR